MTRWLIVIGPAIALAIFFLLLGQGWTQEAAITAAIAVESTERFIVTPHLDYCFLECV